MGRYQYLQDNSVKPVPAEYPWGPCWAGCVRWPLSAQATLELGVVMLL